MCIFGYLSEEGDWLLSHGMCITDVGFDDFREGFCTTL